MKKIDTTLVNASRQFEPWELFFSTTDAKGIITSCNDVFVRVSGYQAEELLGQPHNIVRHPDMPRCVFKLLWDYLLAGKSIGAYVKNLAVTGEYYWVYALVTPVENGFLSIRLKPVSDIFAKVQPLYRQLLSIEEKSGSKWKEGMNEATQFLVTTLNSLGFATYDDFMAVCAREELAAYQQASLAHSVDNAKKKLAGAKGSSDVFSSIFSALPQLFNLQGELNNRGPFLDILDSQLGRIAINSSIRAAHLGANGRTLAVVGEEIARVGHHIKTQSDSLQSELKKLTAALKQTSFSVSLTLLQAEIASSFKKESAGSNLTLTEQTRKYGRTFDEIQTMLSQSALLSVSKSAEGLKDLGQTLRAFEEFSEALGKILLTLQFAYVTGKTQAARVENGEEFSTLLDDLIALSESTRSQITSLNQPVATVKTMVLDWSAEL